MVTEKNYGELLIEAMNEVLAIERGELEPARIVRYPITARTTEVSPPPRYTAEQIRQIRRRLRVSQTVFADLLNVSASTVRAWERGARSPDGPTLRLLEIAERRPDALVGAAT